jgi:hypothetical protein
MFKVNCEYDVWNLAYIANVSVMSGVDHVYGFGSGETPAEARAAGFLDLCTNPKRLTPEDYHRYMWGGGETFTDEDDES